MLERLGVANPKSHMASKYPDGIVLESVFVAPQLQAQLDAAVEDALSSRSWLNAQAVLPASLSSADTANLLEQCVAAQCKGTVSILRSKPLQHT